VKRALIVFTVLVGVTLSGLVLALKIFTGFLVRPAATGSRSVAIVINSGTSIEELDRLLFAQGLLSRPDWFGIYLRHFRKDFKMPSGEYQITASMSPSEIAEIIQRGQVVRYTLVIPGGLTLDQTAELLERDGIVNARSFRKLVATPTVAEALGVPGPTAEGYLFPDAYELPRGMKPREVLELMFRRYRKTVPRELVEQASARDLTEHELVSLAALVELEVRPEERPMFAAMYQARVKKNMPLDSRSALALGLGKTTAELQSEDYKVEADFNTFLRPGVPRRPLVSPSLKAMTIVANPPVLDVLYAAPLGDARHQFCVDKECYNHALARARGETPPPPRPGPRLAPPPPPDE
jgi:UPF0755 protein